MPSEITNYKCPACTGPLRFAGSSGKMQCDYCGSSFSVQEIEALYAEENAQAEAAFEPDENAEITADETHADWTYQSGTDWGEEAEGLCSYNCPSCGAQLLCEEHEGASRCPYCGNPTIVPGQFAGALKPDLIVPFRLEKEEAKAALKKHLSGKKLLPRLFTEEHHIDEIKGVYVPVWLYDADVSADMRYNAQTVRHWSDRDYNYTETRYYLLHRGGTVSFDNVPVDGSEKMPDELMESLEPFDVTQAVPYQGAYLTGYMADRYDSDAEACSQRANERIRNSVAAQFRATTGGFLTVTEAPSRIGVRNGRARYTLLPVWLLTTSWNGKTYQFAMNGQTGKFVGDLPMDKKAYWKYRWIYTGAFGAAAFVLLWLMQL